MSTWLIVLIIAIGILGWLLAGLLVGLVIGGVAHERDRMPEGLDLHFGGEEQ